MNVHKIGDCHLGKKFEAGVPLHRRGDREQMQFAQFEQELLVECDLNVQMGDLFDKMVVPYSVVWRAARAYIAAKRAFPGREYIVLRGNHDASRDADRVSAFQIFAGLVRPHGVWVVDDGVQVYGDHVFLPWHPFKTAAEIVEEAAAICDWNGATAYGHWDVVMGDTNRIPAARLKELGFIKAFTGHDHLARTMKIEGLEVEVTGSMQPYSHAEDPEGRLYVTLTPTDLHDIDVTDKCVRLKLRHDEVFDEVIDCLQLTVTRSDDDTVVDLGEVDFEAFDLAGLFEQARQEVGLDETFGAVVLRKLEEARAGRD